jgi:hypothetical protein
MKFEQLTPELQLFSSAVRGLTALPFFIQDGSRVRSPHQFSSCAAAQPYHVRNDKAAFYLIRNCGGILLGLRVGHFLFFFEFKDHFFDF